MEMTKQVLVIVKRAADCERVLKFVRAVYGVDDIYAYGKGGGGHRVEFVKGGAIIVMAVDNWDSLVLRGRHLDKVIFLCKPRDYIVEQVKHCLVFSKEDEEERIVT